MPALGTIVFYNYDQLWNLWVMKEIDDMWKDKDQQTNVSWIEFLYQMKPYIKPEEFISIMASEEDRGSYCY